VSAERAKISDFQFNAKEIYSPSDFRARSEILALFPDVGQTAKDILRKNAEWAGQFSDEDTVIKWIEEEGMTIPVAVSVSLCIRQSP
jgi:hypothetical protein